MNIIIHIKSNQHRTIKNIINIMNMWDEMPNELRYKILKDGTRLVKKDVNKHIGCLKYSLYGLGFSLIESISISIGSMIMDSYRFCRDCHQQYLNVGTDRCTKCFSTEGISRAPNLKPSETRGVKSGFDWISLPTYGSDSDDSEGYFEIQE